MKSPSECGPAPIHSVAPASTAMATGFAPHHPSRVLPRSRHPLPTPDPGYNPILPIGGEKERVLMRFLADQPYAARGECPPSPPRSLLAEIAASSAGDADRAGGGRDWWGTPDDGTGPLIAGETWCGECLVVVGAGAQRCAYQWQRAAPGGVPESIPGARGPRYVVTEDDLGCRLRCVVSRPRIRRTGAPDRIGANNAKDDDDRLHDHLDDDDDDEVRVARSESVATHAPYHYANGGPTGANDVVSHADDGLRSARSPGFDAIRPGRVGDKGHARSDATAPAAIGHPTDPSGGGTQTTNGDVPRREIVLRPPRGGANHAVDATFALGTQREGEGREAARRGDVDASMAKYAGAERCYRIAADAGHVIAKCRLGRMIEQGWVGAPDGVPDPVRAAALYREAADEGCAEGENNLGALLYLGVAKSRTGDEDGSSVCDPDGDAAEAAALFHRARSRGHAPACSNLALCYEEGRGVAGGRDLERAGALYLEAARAGVVDAYAGAGSVAMMRGDLRDAMAAFRAGAVQGGGDATERLRALAMRRREGRAAMAAERGGLHGEHGLHGTNGTNGFGVNGGVYANGNRLGSGTDLGTIRSEPDTSRAPSMQASDDLPDLPDLPGWNPGWDVDDHADHYEAEIARYYRLSRDLYDAMVGSGDPAMARAAEEAVHEAFPEMHAHH